MTSPAFDIAVVGSGISARLLAGCIAVASKRRVALVVDGAGDVRLARGLALSVAPVTRPDTLALARAGATELQALLGRAAGGVLVRARPVFHAAPGPASDMLRHVRHGLGALGYLSEPTPLPATLPGGEAFAISDALRLSRQAVARLLPGWLAGLGVETLSAPLSALDLARDGGLRVTGRETIEAARTVLADDEASAALVPEGDLYRVLTARQMASLLSEPLPPLAAPLGFATDLGLLWHQRPNGAVEIVGHGPVDALAGRLALRLPEATDWHRAGQARFERLGHADGGGYVGHPGRQGAMLVAGFGAVTAFLMPALARVILGLATPDEAAYFAARGADRDVDRRGVAEWAAEAQPA